MKQLLTFLALLSFFPIFSQTSNMLGQLVTPQTAITAFPFLAICPDVAASGMGDVGIATETTAAGMFFNAAKMAFSKKKFDISTTYSPWLNALKIPGIGYNFAGGYYRINEKQAIGVYSRALLGKGITYCDRYSPLCAGFLEISTGISYSYRLTPHFSLGTTLSWLHSNFDFTNVGSITGGIVKPQKAFIGDIGVYYQNKKQATGVEMSYSAGIVVCNIGKRIVYESNPIYAITYPLPTNFGIGAALRLRFDNQLFINPAIDFHHLLVEKGGNTFSIGNELGKQFSLKKNSLKIVGRAGYFGENKAKGNRNLLTTGIGAEITTSTKLNFGATLCYWFPLSQNNPLQNTIKMELNMGYLF